MRAGNQCPVCQARFRGASVCSRCGADLARLMFLAAEAWRFREGARAALAAGDFVRGMELATQAQQLQATISGDALRRLSGFLAVSSAGEGAGAS